MADEKALGGALTTDNDPIFKRAAAAFAGEQELPEIKAQRDKIAGEQEQVQRGYSQEQEVLKQRQGILDQQVGATRQLQQGIAGVPSLADHASYFKTSTPFFMLLAAVGGIAGRKSAAVGLKAMDEMLKGQMEGNEAKYQMAKQKHDDAIAKIQQEYDTATAVNEMMLKATDGQIDSIRLAREAAANSIGADTKMLDGMRGDFRAIYKDLLTEHNRHKEVSAAQGIAKMGYGALIKDQQGINKSAVTFSKFAPLVYQVKQKWDALTRRIADEKSKNKGNSETENAINALSLVKDDKERILRIQRMNIPEVADFMSLAGRLKPQAVANMNADLSAGNVRALGVGFGQKELESLPDLRNGVLSTQKTIDEMMREVGEIRDLIKARQTDLQSRASRIQTDPLAYFGAPPMSAEAEGEPSQESGPLKITSDAEYDALKPGTEFVGPDGKTRRKPK